MASCAGSSKFSWWGLELVNGAQQGAGNFLSELPPSLHEGGGLRSVSRRGHTQLSRVPF